MSDPVTNVEIEDVLSSIRRLVSEDGRVQPAVWRAEPKAAEAAPAAVTPPPTGRLVLTPALRVTGDEAGPAVPEAGMIEMAEEEPGAADSDYFDNMPIAMAWGTGRSAPDAEALAEEVVAEAAQPAEAALAEEAVAEEAAPYVLGEPAGEPLAWEDHHADHQAEAGEAMPAAHEAAVLEMVAGPGAEDQDAAAQGGAAAGGAYVWQGHVAEAHLADAHVNEGHVIDADVIDMRADDRPMDHAPMDDAAANDLPVDDARADDALADDALADDALADDAALAGAQGLDPTGAAPEADDAAQAERFVFASTREGGRSGAAAQMAEDDDPEDRNLLLAEDEAILDEHMLRELVTEIVRQELQGALGERITRNVRKLVRREIHRALTTHELE
jgi:hypothetical protein